MKSFKQLEEYIYFHKENQILNFIAIIIDIKIGLLEGFIQLTLSNGNEKCEQFIIKNGDIKIYIQNEIQINKINIKEINNCLYFEIINFKINKKKNNLKLNVPIYQFKKIQKINSLDDEILTNNPLISIDLKYNNRKFFDIKREVKVNLNNLNYNFENEKIYSFSNFMIKNNRLESINISSIEELNSNSFLNKYDYLNISQLISSEKQIINFYGKIKNINFIKNIITVQENNNDTQINVNLNFDFIKKISFNGICYFKNFQKLNSNNVKYTEFSNIYIEEKTLIELEFMDYIKDNNKYNIIQIDNQLIEIKNSIIEFELKNILSMNYCTKKIKFLNKKNNENTSSCDLFVDIYKGKKNNFLSYLNLDNAGYSYEFLYQSKNNLFLPISQDININGENKQINKSESFGNKFKKRFVILNIQNQNIVPEKNEEKYKSWKIIYSIQKNKAPFINYLKLKESTFKLRPFILEKEFERQLNDFFINYYNNIQKLIDNIIEIRKNYNLLFIEDKEYSNSSETESNDINESSSESIEEKNEEAISYISYIKYGLSSFKFNNSDKEYQKIKRLCFLYLIRPTNVNTRYKIYVFKDLIKDSKNYNYIDQIKILLNYCYLIDYGISNLSIHLININQNEIIKTAHNLLINIIDKMKEGSGIFKTLNMFNSFVNYDIKIKHHIFSFSLLNENDIKIELIQNMNNYYMIFKEDKNIYGLFSTMDIININFYKITRIKFDSLNILNEFEKKRISSLIFLLLLHEFFGHQKKNINNKNKISPRYLLDNEFKLIKHRKYDTGNCLEIIINGDLIFFNKIRKKKGIEDLLNIELYIKEDFSEFKKIFQKIMEDDIINYELSKKNDKLKGKNDLFDDDDSEFDYELLRERYDFLYSRDMEAFKLAMKEPGYKKMVKFEKKCFKNKIKI